jgi:CRP-like cAMP-binding protein
MHGSPARHRARFLQFLELRDEEDVVTQGTLTTQFVILLHGQIKALQARTGRETYHHKDYGPGDWFGEITTCRTRRRSRPTAPMARRW